jgi:hypothetical protein
VLDMSAPELALDRGKHDVRRPVARVAQIAIARIFRPSQAERAQVVAQLVATDFEQGSNDLAAHGRNARQASPARSAQEAKHHRLDLVVARVCGGDPVGVDVAEPRA